MRKGDAVTPTASTRQWSLHRLPPLTLTAAATEVNLNTCLVARPSRHHHWEMILPNKS